MEVVKLRAARVKLRHNADQWAQPGSNVQMVALWVCIRDYTRMHQSDPVAQAWIPEQEVNPFSPVLICRASEEASRPAPLVPLGLAQSGARMLVLPPLPPVRTHGCLSTTTQLSTIANLRRSNSGRNLGEDDVAQTVFHAVVLAIK